MCKGRVYVTFSPINVSHTPITNPTLLASDYKSLNRIPPKKYSNLETMNVILFLKNIYTYHIIMEFTMKFSQTKVGPNVHDKSTEEKKGSFLEPQDRQTEAV